MAAPVSTRPPLSNDQAGSSGSFGATPGRLPRSSVPPAIGQELAASADGSFSSFSTTSGVAAGERSLASGVVGSPSLAGTKQ